VSLHALAGSRVGAEVKALSAVRCNFNCAVYARSSEAHQRLLSLVAPGRRGVRGSNPAQPIAKGVDPHTPPTKTDGRAVLALYRRKAVTPEIAGQDLAPRSRPLKALMRRESSPHDIPVIPLRLFAAPSAFHCRWTVHQCGSTRTRRPRLRSSFALYRAQPTYTGGSRWACSAPRT